MSILHPVTHARTSRSDQGHDVEVSKGVEGRYTKTTSGQLWLHVPLLNATHARFGGSVKQLTAGRHLPIDDDVRAKEYHPI